ncbi:ABC transporter permease [Microbacterium marinilacus]|uniref:ABC transporter permease n=1 Tax=Microbacterium marinilacus TaxID=415209 RepID=A0ABP7BTA4_9MICO|nr:ABC transporter permease [Microbacterium marinilacus]MBY0689243.1 ABC transporter permease [Microbacterium marinilacus]
MALNILRRLLAGVVLLFVVATVVFVALQLVPGDPARTILTGTGATPTEEAVQALRDELGLNLPLWQQYAAFLGQLATGSLGESLQNGQPVLDLVAQRLPRTLILILTSTVVSVLLGVLIGATAARFSAGRGAWWDRVVLAATSVGVAVPSFVAAVLLVYAFGVQLQWLPSGGFVPFERNPAGFFQSLILPTAALAVGFTGTVARMTRSSVLGVGNQDWVRTGRAVGLRERTVFLRHVLRNSLSPVLTVTGLQMGAMLGGTVIIERVFNYPGLSGLLIDAVTQRDYPIVQGVVLVIAALFVVLNIVVDIAYGFLDPRGRN